MVAWIGPAIAAGASLLGGVLGQRSQEKQARRNEALQREFAQSGVQWRVEDAKAAGVHPAVALGASLPSASSVSVGDSIGPAMAHAGQNISRAISATSSSQQRADLEFQTASRALTLEHQSLQNQVLRSQLFRNQQGVGPPLPVESRFPIIEGQGNSEPPVVPGSVVNRIMSPQPGQVTYGENTALPDVAWSLTPEGRFAVLPSKEAQERMEDNVIAQMFHSMRNYVLPEALGGSRNHPMRPARPGHEWVYMPPAGVWAEIPNTWNYPRPRTLTGR